MNRILLSITMIVCGASILLPRRCYGDDDIFRAVSHDQLREEGFVPLWDGESFRAWDLKPWHEGHWTVRDGVIDYDGKAEHKNFNTNSLWTKNDYGDVELYVEWRLPAEPRMKPQPIVLFNGDFLLDEQGRRITRLRPDGGDSGVLLRGILDCQANIWCQELGSGEINGYRTNQKIPPAVRRAAIPMMKADRPIGEWNAFMITLKGNSMSVSLNDQLVIENAYLPDLPITGPIGLQHHGDRVQFRNLWIRELD